MPRKHYPLVKHLLVCLWGCFQKRLTFESTDWLKKIAVTMAGRHRPVSWHPNKKRKGQFILCFKLGHSSFFALGHQCSWFPDLQTWAGTYIINPLIRGPLDLNWNLCHQLSWFSGFWTWTELNHQLSCFLALSRLWNFLSSTSTGASGQWSILLVLFYWRTVTNTSSYSRVLLFFLNSLSVLNCYF